MSEIEIPHGVPEETYLRVLRAFFGADPDSDHPSNGLLQGLLEAPVFFRHAVAVAFRAGRESAYTTDEWRVVAGPEEFPVVFQDEIRSEEHLEIVLRDARNRWRGEAIRVQRRRVGVTGWEKVADA